MLEEMDTLETKLELLLERHRAMHAENLRLRQQVVAMENANKLLTDRLSEARGRMEKLFNTLPD
jgi:predicted RNase H-like nuclease (RuvC/YqgF family)